MNKNIFSKIDTQKASIKLQQATASSSIDVKKRGRPVRPNMVKKLIKVDKTLYAQLAEKAKTEHTTIAYLLSKAIKSIINN